MQRAVNKFIGVHKLASERVDNTSGASLDDVMPLAKSLFQTSEGGEFGYLGVWEFLKHDPKFAGEQLTPDRPPGSKAVEAT